MLYAVTLHQPWASAIAAGVKPCENRPWIPKALRAGPLWLALHAGKATDPVDLAELEALGFTRRPPFPRGFLALVRFSKAGPLEGSGLEANAWATGPQVWTVDRVHELATPIPAKGSQGLWKVPPSFLPAFGELYRSRTGLEVTPWA